MQNASRSRNKNNNDSNQQDFVPDLNSLILVTINERKQRVEVHIRGPFLPSHMVSTQIATLYDMSDKYGTVMVYINSPGGSVETMAEILAALSRFNTVITVAAGQVCSAGFFLWASGHIRVVQKYTVLMAHRESYVFSGKTEQHIEFGTYTNKMCGSMIDDLCGDILLPAEKERIRTTEVFLDCDEILARKKAITWEQFVARDDMALNIQEIATIDGEDYFLEGDCAVDNDGNVYKLVELIYDIPEKNVYKTVDEEQ